MRSLCCHLRPLVMSWPGAATKGFGWVFGPTAAGVCVNVCGLRCPQRPCRYMWSELPPEAMMALRHILLPGAMPGFVVAQSQLGSVLTSKARIITKSQTYIPGLNWYQRPCRNSSSVLSWSCPLLTVSLGRTGSVLPHLNSTVELTLVGTTGEPTQG